MQKKKMCSLASVLLVSLAGCVRPAGAAGIQVYSSALREQATVPKQYTGEGQDLSPPIAWGQLPKETKSVALTCEDPDAPKGTWFHWIIFNMSPKTQQLGQGVPRVPEMQGGVYQGVNDFGKIGYNGPLPPPGQTHRYQFKVMALNKMLSLKGGCDKNAFQQAIKGAVIGEGRLTAKYSR